MGSEMCIRDREKEKDVKKDGIALILVPVMASIGGVVVLAIIASLVFYKKVFAVAVQVNPASSAS